MFKFLMFVMVVISTSSFGALSHRFECNFLNPKAHPDFKGYVYKAEFAVTGKTTSNLVVHHRSSLGSEELTVPLEYTDGEVTIGSGALTPESVKGAWDFGDTWIDVTYDEVKERFVGVLTLAQDFEYQVSCSYSQRTRHRPL